MVYIIWSQKRELDDLYCEIEEKEKESVEIDIDDEIEKKRIELKELQNYEEWMLRGFCHETEFSAYDKEGFKRILDNNKDFQKTLITTGGVFDGVYWYKEKYEKIALFSLDLACKLVIKSHYKKDNQEIEARFRVLFEKINKCLPDEMNISKKFFQLKLDEILIRKQYIRDKRDGVLSEDEEVETYIEDDETISIDGEKEKKGWIYVVSSPSFNRENQFKIGLTKRNNPSVRIDELSSSAGLPFTYKVHALFEVDDCFKVEKQLHDAFRDRIFNRKKEHFLVDLKEIDVMVEKIGFKNVEFDYNFEHKEYEENKKRLKRIGVEL